jgi:hypothetical protein
VEEGTLARNVPTLRKVLGDPEGQTYIETVPRRGYSFVAPVHQEPCEEPAGLAANTIHDHVAIRGESWPSQSRLWLLAVGPLAILLANAHLLWLRPPHQGSPGGWRASVVRERNTGNAKELETCGQQRRNDHDIEI